MVHIARGVTGKLTEAGNDMYEPGLAAAGALRQLGEQSATEFHEGRRPGAPVTDLQALALTCTTRCEDGSWAVTLYALR